MKLRVNACVACANSDTRAKFRYESYLSFSLSVLAFLSEWGAEPRGQ